MSKQVYIIEYRISELETRQKVVHANTKEEALEIAVREIGTDTYRGAVAIYQEVKTF